MGQACVADAELLLEETKFACVDGPDFDGFLVDFDELSRRQNMYRDIEYKYDETHSCKIGLGTDNMANMSKYK